MGPNFGEFEKEWVQGVFLAFEVKAAGPIAILPWRVGHFPSKNDKILILSTGGDGGLAENLEDRAYLIATQGVAFRAP